MSGILDQDYLYIGQTYERIVPLRVDGKPYDITGATVTVRFTKVVGSYATNNGSPISATDAVNGSDYSCGVVGVKFEEADTTGLSTGVWTLEVKVAEAGGDILIFQCNPSVNIVPTGHTS